MINDEKFLQADLHVTHFMKNNCFEYVWIYNSEALKYYYT